MPNFMFFNKGKKPLAVFCTDTEDAAIALFVRLYKKPWKELVNEIMVINEEDITLIEWQEICKKPKGLPFEGFNVKAPPRDFIEEIAAVIFLRNNEEKWLIP